MRGAERVARHERLDRWRCIMEDRGFEAVPLSPAAVGQSQVPLGFTAPVTGTGSTRTMGASSAGRIAPSSAPQRGGANQRIRRLDKMEEVLYVGVFIFFVG
ncbi:hypothetical protein ZWY2020_010189 [Hordeum vulgare]|nr:hypothetical protein ZWY2020_010189 [Hordeum vulgare]